MGLLFLRPQLPTGGGGGRLAGRKNVVGKSQKAGSNLRTGEENVVWTVLLSWPLRLEVETDVNVETLMLFFRCSV